MAEIKYSVKENTNLGTHSFYAVAQSYSTLDFNDLADEVVEGLGISPEMVPTILTRYVRVATRNVLRGHRVKIGDLMTIYPQLSCSVKDELNDDGTLKKAVTLDMFSLAGAKSTIGATIAQSVQQRFSSSVSWKRITVQTTDDETTDPTEPGTDEPEATAPDAPTISGTTPFDGTTSVTITAADGATIRYTIDGADPTTESPEYTAPVTLTATATVKAIAVKDGLTSEVASKSFTKNNPGDNSD